MPTTDWDCREDPVIIEKRLMPHGKAADSIGFAGAGQCGI
jgi:hypothetical protein